MYVFIYRAQLKNLQLADAVSFLKGCKQFLYFLVQFFTARLPLLSYLFMLRPGQVDCLRPHVILGTEQYFIVHYSSHNNHFLRLSLGLSSLLYSKNHGNGSLRIVQNCQASRSIYKASEDAQMRHYYSTFVSLYFVSSQLAIVCIKTL